MNNSSVHSSVFFEPSLSSTILSRFVNLWRFYFTSLFKLQETQNVLTSNELAGWFITFKFLQTLEMLFTTIICHSIQQSFEPRRSPFMDEYCNELELTWRILNFSILVDVFQAVLINLWLQRNHASKTGNTIKFQGSSVHYIFITMKNLLHKQLHRNLTLIYF